MLYLYAISERTDKPLPDAQGIGGYPLFSLQDGNLIALVSESDASEPATVEENLWLHEAIVENLMAERSVLPVRFGTRVADAAQMQLRLATHHDRFVAALDHVRGRVELGLRLLWNDDGAGDRGTASIEPEPRAPVSAGRAYLNARLQQERQVQARKARAEDMAAQLRTTLAPLAIDSVVKVLATPRLLLTAAYLVDHRSVEAFRTQVQGMADSLPHLQMLCTGPWPAYSFVTGCIPQSPADRGGSLSSLLQDI
jgi:hypothetical protein